MTYPNILIFALSAAGLGFVCLGMDRHAKQALGKAPPLPRGRARLGLGAAMLVLSFGSSVQAYGVSIGITVFFGVIAIVSAGIALSIAYRPSLLRFLGGLAALVAMSVALAGFFS
ncbi:MAG: DUF3325 domain-containing protein [Candidatus Accumulibacter sp.]|jgi:hypothetical protein|nr:DUF3325 domain-containing protein [Accumulibacter sp.]